MIYKNVTVGIRMTKADRDLIAKAADATQQRVGSWGRAIMVTMALWQLEGDVKLAPQHEALLRHLQAQGLYPVKKKGKSAA